MPVLDRIGCTRKERVFAKRKMEGRAVLDTVPSGTLRDVPGGAVVVIHCGCVLLREAPSFNFSERHAEAAGGRRRVLPSFTPILIFHHLSPASFTRGSIAIPLHYVYFFKNTIRVKDGER